jgi:SAM-dependent methyltransferase
MHPSSYDKMAEFCRDYLGPRRNEPLTIMDLGSCDYSGSYRPLFTQGRWRYLGVDLAAGKNVDLVLRDPYHWRELKSESVDVLISGQTLEHTEFFWETILEIARVLKPHGLCCLIAPSAGPEHRYPLDCWRIYADGFRAIARYAGLEVLYARTQWSDRPGYDSESNKWHESILIACKRPEPRGEKIRRRLWRTLQRRLQPLPPKVEALIQVFYTSEGIHREEDSVVAGVEHLGWTKVFVRLPGGAGAAPLRIDFMGAISLVEISELQVTSPGKKHFAATTSREFESIRIEGNAKRFPDKSLLRLQITGPDPQLYLPSLEIGAEDHPLTVEVRLRVHPQT